MRSIRRRRSSLLPLLILVLGVACCSPSAERRAASIERGRTAYATYRCGECHDHASGTETAHPPSRHPMRPENMVAPSLRYAGSRSPRDWIESFLTREPADGAAVSREEAAAIALFLETRRDPSIVPEGGGKPGAPPPDPSRAERGREIFRGLGCPSCHRVGQEGERIGPELTNAGRRLRPAYVIAVLRDPQKVTPGSQMPSLALSEEQIDLLASYLRSLRD